jgi:N-acetylglucosaminyldiphosphoundecaprenol N-acetyl-beta-D-mannosaminyltransferase
VAGAGAIDLLGMRIDALTPAQAVARIVDGDGGCVLTPNLQHLRAYARSAEVRAAFDRCELVVADGMPLVWAGRLQGTPLPERVAGSDLVFTVAAAAATRGRSLFLLGGSPGVAQEAAVELERLSPGLRIAGTCCPPLGFECSPETVDRLATEVSATDPGIVFIGLPLEKQLVMMSALREVVPDAWQLGLGASFSFVSGDIPRAPAWMQRSGLEWSYRLIQEPRRLGRRYLIEGPPFLLRLMADASWRRVRPRGGRQAAPRRR